MRLLVPLAGLAGAAVLANYLIAHPEAIAIAEAASSLLIFAGRGEGSFGPALLGHLVALGWAAALGGIAWLAGRAAGAVLFPGAVSGVATMGLGLGVLALTTFACGLCGLLHPLGIAILAAAGALAAILRGWRGGAGRASTKAKRPHPLWLAAGVLLVSDLLASLTPEWFYDARVYHLGLPELFLALEKFPVRSENLLTFLPLNCEMIYALGLGLGGEECARCLNLCFGGMLALAVAQLAGRIVGGAGESRAAALAGFFLLGMPLSMVENETAFADNLRALWEVLALSAFLRGGRGLAAAGVFMGLALGAKYLAAIGGVYLAGAAVLTAFRNGAARRSAAAYLVLAALAASPWLARNWLAGGDPVYPFGRAVFEPLRFGEREFSRWMADNRHYGVEGMTAAKWLTLPYRLVMDRVDGEFGTFTTGPLPLVFLPLLLFRRAWPRAALLPAGYLAVQGIVWSFTSHLVRYLLPGLAVLCALMAWAAAELGRASGRYARLALVYSIIWAGGALILRVHHRANLEGLYGVFSHFAGKAGQAELKARRGFGQPLDALPAGTVLMLGEERVLGLGRVWRAASVYDVPLAEGWARESFSAGEFAVKVRQAGIKTVLLNGEGFARRRARGDFDLDARSWSVINGWWRGLGTVFRDPPLSGYAVDAGQGNPEIASELDRAVK